VGAGKATPGKLFSFLKPRLRTVHHNGRISEQHERRKEDLMKHPMFKSAALAMAVPGLAMAAPALAAPAPHSAAYAHSAVWGDQNVEHGRKHHRQYERYQRSSNRYYGGSNYRQNYYGEPVYNNTRVWRGNDNRYYCQRSNGTTGLLIGGAAGALLGREVAGRGGDRTLGAILGAAGGALLGREIDRGGSRCR
jgi:hypothetical protein